MLKGILDYTIYLQIYVHLYLNFELAVAGKQMEDCLDTVNCWMTHYFMCINNDKIEYLPIGPISIWEHSLFVNYLLLISIY